jgi:hypothetical protein
MLFGRVGFGRPVGGRVVGGRVGGLPCENASALCVGNNRTQGKGIGELKSVGMYVTQLWRGAEYCARARAA